MAVVITVIGPHRSRAQAVHRGWQELGHASPFPFPFPLPAPWALAQLRMAERWGTLGSQMLFHSLEQCQM